MADAAVAELLRKPRFVAFHLAVLFLLVLGIGAIVPVQLVQAVAGAVSGIVQRNDELASMIHRQTGQILVLPAAVAPAACTQRVARRV